MNYVEGFTHTHTHTLPVFAVRCRWGSMQCLNPASLDAL